MNTRVCNRRFIRFHRHPDINCLPSLGGTKLLRRLSLRAVQIVPLSPTKDYDIVRSPTAIQSGLQNLLLSPRCRMSTSPTRKKSMWRTTFGKGILAIERTLTTHNWRLRLISTVLGIILVDAYCMYRLDHQNDQVQLLTFRTFTEKIASGLVKNALKIKDTVGTRRRRTECTPRRPSRVPRDRGRSAPSSPRARYPR